MHCLRTGESLTLQESFFQEVNEVSWLMGLLVLLFILFGSLTVMNMLLGIHGLVHCLHAEQTDRRLACVRQL